MVSWINKLKENTAQKNFEPEVGLEARTLHVLGGFSDHLSFTIPLCSESEWGQPRLY